MTYTVEVSNLSPKTTTPALRDFFTFCGAITSIDHNAGSKTACIVFEKAQAAKTALMLNGGTLDGSSINVSSDQVHPDQPDSSEQGGSIEQSDKPRAGIAAEYLAKGYVLSDSILQKAIEMDVKNGISQRFLNYIKSLDKTLGEKIGGPEPHLVSAKVSNAVGGALAGARERASSIDQERGISKQAGDYYSKAVNSEYYANAVNSPIGQKVYDFYTTTSKQVADLHEEARRIAAEQKAAATAPAS
jgi:hypothetical protein